MTMFLITCLGITVIASPVYSVVTFEPNGFENVEMSFEEAEFDVQFTGDFQVKNMIRCNVACLQVTLQDINGTYS